MTLLLAAAAALLALAPAASAQTADLLPRDLVLALVTQGEDTRIDVGSPPPELPAGLPIPPGRVVGGLSRSGGGGTLVVEVEEPPGSAAEAYGRRLEAAGFERPRVDRGGGGGFEGNAFPALDAWCGADAFVTLEAMGLEGRTYLRVNHQQARRSPCSPLGGGRPAGFAVRLGTLPSLSPPPGVRVTPRGGGGSPTHRDSQALVETTLPPAEIAASFGDQLEAAGWVRTGGVAEAGVAVSRWSVPAPEGDEEGVAGTGLLVVWSGPEGDGLRALLRSDRPDGER